MLEREIIDALRKNQPFEKIPGVRVSGFEEQPLQGRIRFDVAFRLESGPNSVLVYGEIKNTCTPKIV